MSLAAVIALLQSALMLLSLAQSSPNIPPATKDAAMQIAQQAISEATKAISSGALTSANTNAGQSYTAQTTAGNDMPTIYSFTANVSSVTASQPVVFSWSSNAQNCSVLKNESNGGYTLVASNVGSATSYTINPTATATYTLQCLGKNPGNGKDAASAMKSISITVTPSPVSCAINSDKATYALGENITFSWTSTNANYASFVPDTSGKENLTVPGDKLAANGSQIISASVHGNPFVTLKVVSADNQSATCTKTVSVQ